jgi:hypothetical protein
MTPDEQHVYALAGMFAAIEYARVQHTGMSGAAAVADVQAALNAIAADCERGNLDILGSLATLTLRAATLACQASAAAGHPMTVPEFLDELERELTPPDDPSGL